MQTITQIGIKLDKLFVEKLYNHLNNLSEYNEEICYSKFFFNETNKFENNLYIPSFPSNIYESIGGELIERRRLPMIHYFGFVFHYVGRLDLVLQLYCEIGGIPILVNQIIFK